MTRSRDAMADLVAKDEPARVVGDGGFSMLMAEFATAGKYELPIKVVVVKNNTLGQIKWEQMVFLGNPEYGCDLHPIDFAAFARACGGAGFRIEDPGQCGAVLDQYARARLTNWARLVSFAEVYCRRAFRYASSEISSGFRPNSSISSATKSRDSGSTSPRRTLGPGAVQPHVQAQVTAHGLALETRTPRTSPLPPDPTTAVSRSGRVSSASTSSP